MKTIFDIETIALPLGELEKLCPPFDKEAVKLGNLKDQAKIDAKLAEAEKNHFANFCRDAALDARYSQCKLAGFYTPYNDADVPSFAIFAHETDAKAYKALDAAAKEIGVQQFACFRDEKVFIKATTMMISDLTEDDGQVIGYYSHEFDIPYIARRAWITGTPFSMRPFRRGRYFRDNIVDLYAEWNLGQKEPPKAGGLNGLAKLLGCKQEKSGEGFQFGELYAKDPAEGLAYLLNDLRCTAEVAERMGVL